MLQNRVMAALNAVADEAFLAPLGDAFKGKIAGPARLFYQLFPSGYQVAADWKEYTY